MSTIGLGQKLGEGKGRRVYLHPERDDWVIKVPKAEHQARWNRLEWEIWEQARNTPFALHFAPCLELTDEGHLVMARADRCRQTGQHNLTLLDITIKDSRKPQNRGILNGRIVLIDYGHSSALPLPEKLRAWRNGKY